MNIYGDHFDHVLIPVMFHFPEESKYQEFMRRRKRGEKERRERCEDFMIGYQKMEGKEIKPKDLIESRIMHQEMMMKVEGEKF